LCGSFSCFVGARARNLCDQIYQLGGSDEMVMFIERDREWTYASLAP
jgi:hypothetical protein